MNLVISIKILIRIFDQLISNVRINLNIMKLINLILAIIFSILGAFSANSQETCCNALNLNFTLVYCFTDVSPCVEGVFPCNEANFEALFPGVDIFAGSEQCSFPNITCNLTGFCSGGQISLPVELIDFKTTFHKEGILLKWTTASEINNSGFSIEKSPNGIDWTTISFVEGYGNSNINVDYDFLDRSPILGANYYRLKQIDYDETYDYSPIKVALYRGDINNQELAILPNLASQHIVPVLPNNIAKINTIVVYDILDMNGQLIRSMTNLVARSGTEINIENLVAGSYMLLVKSAGQKYYSRFVKI